MMFYLQDVISYSQNTMF